MIWTNQRVRTVSVVGVALLAVAGIGIGVANTSQAADSRWVTTVVQTGDVTQTYITTGSITRKNTSAASFSVDGTVKEVKVAVGDSVEAGQVLATLKKGSLQLAVLEAETSVARANASLYAAKHPSSTSSGSSGSGSGSSGGSGSGGTGATVTIDPAVLSEAASRINLAVLDEAEKCEPVFGSILPDPEPPASRTATGTTSASATATATPTGEATTAATRSSEPTATATPTGTEQAKAADSPTPTASASGLAARVEANDPTAAELQTCANARAEVLAANANLQTVVAQLLTPRAGGGTGATKATTKKSSSSSSVSESAVASAEASLLEADQKLAAAQADLDSAELVAPISGTVGVVGLTKGDDASAGSITIIGEGSAVVSFELPLSTRTLIKVGQAVTVTPAGATGALDGKLTAINSLESSGTSGDTPTYTTTVAVSDAKGLLATGGKASVSIPVKSVTGVVRVPASTVTPTGTGTATVQVLSSASAATPETATVKTGAVGGGWVEITSGLTQGQIVVMADTTAAIPANANRRRTTTTSTTTASTSPTSAATAAASTQPSSTPTATASR